MTNTKTYIFSPSKPKVKARIIDDRNYQDKYSDPGNFVTRKGKYGEMVLALDNSFGYLIGEGFSSKGQFPFLDKIDFKSFKKERIYESTYTDKFEQIIDYDLDDKKISVRIESKNEYPNYFFRDLNGINKLEQITFFDNPFKT